MALKVIWSDLAYINLVTIVEYVQQEWGVLVIQILLQKIHARIELIKRYPYIFPKSEIKRGYRKSVLTKHLSIYYIVSSDKLTIVTLFDTRQDSLGIT